MSIAIAFLNRCPQNVSARSFFSLLASQFLWLLLFLEGCGPDEHGVLDQSVADTVVVDSLTKRYDILCDSIKLNPNDPMLYYRRAAVLMAQDKNTDANYDLDRAVKLNADIPQFYIMKGDIAYEKGDTKRAYNLFSFAIDLDPDNIEARLRLAEMYLTGGAYDKAIGYLDEVLKRDVHHARAYFIKGMVFKYSGDTAKALSTMQTALEQDPDYYDANMQLGLMCSQLNMSIATEYFDNAIRLRPNSIEAIYGKSLYLQNHGNPEKALEGYHLILKINPDYFLAWFNIGFCESWFFKDFNAALEAYTNATLINPGYYEAFSNKGLCFECVGLPDSAEVNYRKAIAIQPDFTPAAKGISRVVDGEKDPAMNAICDTPPQASRK